MVAEQGVVVEGSSVGVDNNGKGLADAGPLVQGGEEDSSVGNNNRPVPVGSKVDKVRIFLLTSFSFAKFSTNAGLGLPDAGSGSNSSPTGVRRVVRCTDSIERFDFPDPRVLAELARLGGWDSLLDMVSGVIRRSGNVG